MLFEVFIPSTDPDGFDVTLRVDAANWMEALRLGLQRTDAEARAVRNVFCDIKDNDLLHVTDLASRRVFKIRRISADSPLPEPNREGAPAAAGGPTGAEATARAGFRHPQEFPAVRPSTPVPDVAATPAAAPPRPRAAEPPRLKSGESLGITLETGLHRMIGSREIAQVTLGSSGMHKVVLEHIIPTQERTESDSPPIGRDFTAEDAAVPDSALEQVFLEAAGLFEGESTLEQAVAFALDLALKYIPAESGSVLFTDDSGDRLYFAAARGPKARDLLERDFVVPIDRGLVGFCTREGMSVAISDAGNDPRFYSEISEELGYASQSIACAPVQAEGRAFGAIEVVNHARGEQFSGSDLNILTYIGNQTGRFIQNLLQ